jgi:hypothetical protein
VFAAFSTGWRIEPHRTDGLPPEFSTQAPMSKKSIVTSRYTSRSTLMHA